MDCVRFCSTEVSPQHFDYSDDAIVVDKSTHDAKPHSIC